MKKKILLAILIVVVLLGAGVAYAYFATDIFKTEKEIFFSYMLTDNILEEFQEEKIVEYLEKQENMPYTNKGEITLNMSGEESEGLDIINKTKIALEGKTNARQKLSEQNITLDFGQGFNIPIKFRQAEDTYGIQSDFIDSKFVAVKNENLKKLFERFDLETEGIPDKIELKEEQFTEEELKTLQERYLQILNDNLGEELFSKEKLNNQTIVTLSMPEEKLIQLLTKILETVRNDEILLSKIPVGYEKQEIQEKIDEMISDLAEMKPEEANKFEIKMYVEAKKIKKYEMNFLEDSKSVVAMVIEKGPEQIVIKIYDESTLIGSMSILKEAEGNDVSYKISINMQSEGNSVRLDYTMQYKNVLTLDNVEEIYDIKISVTNSEEDENDDIDSSFSIAPQQIVKDDMELSIKYSNTKTFNTNLEIEALNENNAIILNDATDQELQNLMINVYQKMGLI